MSAATCATVYPTWRLASSTSTAFNQNAAITTGMSPARLGVMPTAPSTWRIPDSSGEGLGGGAPVSAEASVARPSTGSSVDSPTASDTAASSRHTTIARLCQG
jgi:hypothetical protein